MTPEEAGAEYADRGMTTEDVVKPKLRRLFDEAGATVVLRVFIEWFGEGGDGPTRDALETAARIYDARHAED